jgi:hypothetical protein
LTEFYHPFLICGNTFFGIIDITISLYRIFENACCGIDPFWFILLAITGKEGKWHERPVDQVFPFPIGIRLF